MLLDKAEQLVGKLDAQDAGQSKRGRKLSDGGVVGVGIPVILIAGIPDRQ